MKTNSTSQAAFFNARLLIGFALCSAGLVVALAPLSQSVAKASTAIANPVPLINQPLVPDAVAPGGAGFTLTVNGTGFVSGSVVNWNGSPRATTFVTNSQLTAAILASDIATASTTSVAVVNPAPGGGISNTIFFPINVPISNVSFRRSDFPSTASTGPLDVATADFNGDGKLDLVLSNGCCGSTTGESLSIFIGNGDGTFQALADYATAEDPGAVALGDFNRDGNLDVVTSGYASSEVSVLLGNGDGTFQDHIDYATGPYPDVVIVADFNKDGNLDLATSNPGPGFASGKTVSILLGNGDGTFQRHKEYRADDVPDWLVAGDFNNDGSLDLAVSNEHSDNVSILLGNGDGTFQSPVNFATGGSFPFSPVAADFNGDGKLDVAVANSLSNTISILLGNGDGTLQSAVTYSVEDVPHILAAADFNRDSILDLVVNNSESDTISLLPGNADGTFEPRVDYAALEGAGTGDLRPADFNGDGALDLVFTDPNIQKFSIFLQAAPVSKNCLPPPTGLVSWWSGDRTADDVQGTNNGELVGGTSYKPGMVGPGFVFPGGLNDYVQVGDNPSLKMTTAMTVECWVNPTKIQEGIFVNREGEYEFGVDLPDGRLFWAFANADPGWVAILVDFVPPLGSWTHVAVTYDNGLITTYGNGVEVHQFQGSGPIGDVVPTQNDFRIGNRSFFPEPFAGRIDEVKVYNRALSSDEIAAIYSAGSEGNCKPEIFVSSITPSYTVSGHGFRISTSIEIQDVNGVATSDATVQLGVILPSGSALTFPLKTDATGQADVSFKVTDRGLYQFKVRNVIHGAREYDPALNIETTDTLLIP